MTGGPQGEATPRPKRKTWKDRRCGHGNPPAFRITLDMIHCNVPGCWAEVVRSCGFVTKAEHDALIAAERQGLLEALRKLSVALKESAQRLHSALGAADWSLHAGDFDTCDQQPCTATRAALAEAEKGESRG